MAVEREEPGLSGLPVDYRAVLRVLRGVFNDDIVLPRGDPVLLHLLDALEPIVQHVVDGHVGCFSDIAPLEKTESRR